jgi:short-subunit dehydrogenase
MGSVWGRVSSPQVSAYVASEHAVHAFSECLREELRNDRGIDVATMLPQAADTPIFRHAGNYTGRQVCPIPPLVTAEAVAEGILACARNPKREVTFGRAGRLVEAVHLVAPALYLRLLPPFSSAGRSAASHGRRRPATCTARASPTPKSKAVGSTGAGCQGGSLPPARCSLCRWPDCL